VVLEYDGVSVRIASNIESMTFTLTNRLLQIDLHSGARRRDGSIQRFAGARDALPAQQLTQQLTGVTMGAPRREP